ncbi:hypothetical protein R5R35_013149 [Gryllus longicercus]
MCAKFMW